MNEIDFPLSAALMDEKLIISFLIGQDADKMSLLCQTEQRIVMLRRQKISEKEAKNEADKQKQDNQAAA